jgi:hypothetical protein
MGGDPIQPRQRRALAGAVARGGDQRRGEHLGGQVGGQLGVTGAPQEETEDGRQMAAVEPDERLYIAANEPRQQLVVIADRRHHHSLLA